MDYEFLYGPSWEPEEDDGYDALEPRTAEEWQYEFETDELAKRA